MADFNWNGGFTLDFSMLDGMCRAAAPTVRRLSQMRGAFADSDAQERAIANGDPVVYEFYELGAPEQSGDLAFGTSIVYPGKIGDEYYMTKGHFHAILETAEVYYALSGEGAMLTENPEGDVALHALIPGKALYVPKRYAHRSVNTGKVPLVTFFVFRADAGHNYGAIENGGFRSLVLEGADGAPVLADNPRRKNESQPGT